MLLRETEEHDFIGPSQDDIANALRVMRMPFRTLSRGSQKPPRYYLRQFPGGSLIKRAGGQHSEEGLGKDPLC